MIDRLHIFPGCSLFLAAALLFCASAAVAAPPKLTDARPERIGMDAKRWHHCSGRSLVQEAEIPDERGTLTIHRVRTKKIWVYVRDGKIVKLEHRGFTAPKGWGFSAPSEYPPK